MYTPFQIGFILKYGPYAHFRYWTLISENSHGQTLIETIFIFKILMFCSSVQRYLLILLHVYPIEAPLEKITGFFPFKIMEVSLITKVSQKHHYIFISCLSNLAGPLDSLPLKYMFMSYCIFNDPHFTIERSFPDLHKIQWQYHPVKYNWFSDKVHCSWQLGDHWKCHWNLSFLSIELMPKSMT